MRRNLNNALTRGLVIWFAVFQIIHLASLIRAAIVLLQEGVFTFPALPPKTGWTPQAAYFLTGMGILDALNIVISLIFVYGFFTYAKWRLPYGVLSLTVMMYSALVFAFATIASGAWRDNLASYIGMTVAFIPVAVLYFLLTFHVLKGRFYESIDSRTTFY